MLTSLLRFLKILSIRHGWLALLLVISLGLGGCALPQVSAEERLFLNLSLDFLGAYTLPDTTVEQMPVGGLSGLTYDRQHDRFYLISDDRSHYGPARFYTARLLLDTASEAIALKNVEIETVTPLQNAERQPFAAGSLDPEGIALSPRQSVFIASEGVARQAIAPFIKEFDLATGQEKGSLPIPQRYMPQESEAGVVGVQDNLGFEALTLNPGGFSSAWLEPFRLFAATESFLAQDLPDSIDPEQPSRSRFLHYLIGDDLPALIAEHLYLIEPPAAGAIANGLTELLTLDQAGHFLALERSIGLNRTFSARLFQIATGGATDTSAIASLKGDISGIVPIQKQLLLDLATLNLSLDNLEGMTLGPQLPDGTQSLVLVSDNNFDSRQITQFLLFRLRGL